jgi:hypothetical protein
MFFSELSDSQMILKSELREARQQNELLTEAGKESLRIAERWKELHEVAAIELRETQKRVRELESEIEVRDNSANIVFDTLKKALPNHGFHSEMEAAEAAKDEIAELRQELEGETEALNDATQQYIELKSSLDVRDRRMKALGAAEWLEDMAARRWALTHTIMLSMAKELRDRADVIEAAGDGEGNG